MAMTQVTQILLGKTIGIYVWYEVSNTATCTRRSLLRFHPYPKPTLPLAEPYKNPMKPRRLASQFLFFLSITAISQAADIIKANNTTSLDNGTSWTGNVVPSSSDMAIFTNTSGTTASIGTGVSFAGIRYTNAAAYNITAGTGTLTIGASGIDMSAATANHTISAPLVLNTDQFWNVAAGRTLVITGTTGFNQNTYATTLNGGGTVQFNPTTGTTASSATGSFTVNKGTLNLNAATTSPNYANVVNILSPNTPLILGGGALTITEGNYVGTYTQNFNGLSINPGHSTATQTRGASSQVVQDFRTVTRTIGGTISFGGAGSTTSGYKFGNGANGIVGGFMTYGTTDFMRFVNATNLNDTADCAAVYAADTWGATNNTNVTIDSTQTNATTNSLRFAAASARTITLSGTNTITSGGLLNSSGVGAFNNLITGGALRGSNSGDLIVHQHNTTGNLTIASEIANNTGATALTKAGAGTLILSGMNTFTGGVYLNAGAIQLGSPSALNQSTPNQVIFTNNSSARLQLAGNNVTLSGLNTSTVLAATLPVVENGSASDSILTVSNSSNNTFAGTLQNGSTGTLGITKSSSGTLTLSGSNTATGPIQITAGTLALAGGISLPASSITIGAGATLDLSARAGGGINLSSTQTLAGLGSVNGSISTVLGSKIVPGGNGSIGNLSINSLNIGTSTTLNFELADTGTSSDVIAIGNANGLVLGSGIQVNLSPLTGGQFANGIGNTYTLLNYSGSLSGTGTSGGTITASTFSVANPVGGLTYSFQDTGSAITLTIGGSLANDATWQGTTDLSWNNSSNWSTSLVPQNSGDSARFGSSIGTTPAAITLDGSKTVALLEFNNAVASYSLNAGSGGSLTIDNGVSAGQINVSAGNHTLNVPLIFNSDTIISISGSENSLALTSELGGSGAITKSGSGVLALSGNSSYSGTINLNGGTTSVGSGAIGTTGTMNFGGGTLRFANGNTEDVSSLRSINLLTGGGIFDTNGNTVELTGSLQGSGGLTKTGSGVLTLSGSNSYSGGTTINAGVLKIGAVGNLGANPLTPTPGNISINAGTLELTAGIDFPANRGIALTSSNASIVLPASSTSSISSIIAGTGKLNLSGAASLTLAGANTYSGGTVIEGGSIITLNTTTALGSGQTELRDSQLTINTATSSVANLLVSAGKTGTVDGIQIRPGVNGLSGAGDVTFLSRSGGNNASSNGFAFRLQGSYTSFGGILRLKSAVTDTVNSFALHFNGGGFNGNLADATLILSDNARLCGLNNSAGNTVNIGALSGDTTAILAGADYAGSQTYNIGAKNLDTTFQGLITNGSGGNAHIIKSGSGSLTLTGANTYAGTTTVNSGTLAITNSSALGSDTVGTTINGGDVNGQVAITGDLTLTEALTIGGRQGLNLDAPHIVNRSGNNQLSASAITPATGGSNYNFQSDQGNLKVLSHFTPSGAVTGARFLQLLGDGNGEWSGSIGNGTATLSLRKAGAGTWILSGMNHYTGDTTVDAGTLSFTSTSETKFNPTSNGTSNQIAGNGAVTLDGKFDINLASANLTNGNSWLLVNTANLTETYGANFSVNGFTKTGNDWMKVDGAATWTFSETTGLLSLSLITDPFIPWLANYFPGETNAAIIGKGADPDNDGRNNLAEFAFNSNPSSATSDGKVVGKVIELNGNRIWTLTLPVRTGATFSDDANTHEEVSGLIDGIIYRIQGSADLNAWTLDVSEIEAVQTGLPVLETGWSYRTFRAPGTVATEPSDFLRVKITE